MDTGGQKLLVLQTWEKDSLPFPSPYPQEMPVVSSAQVLDNCSGTPGIPWDEFDGGRQGGLCVFLRNKVRNSLSSRDKGHIP